MSVKKTVSKRLKEARVRIGFTILKASRLSNIKYSDLCRFERGTQEPKFSQLARLAEIYRVTTDDLMGDKPIKREQCLWCE